MIIKAKIEYDRIHGYWVLSVMAREKSYAADASMIVNPEDGDQLVRAGLALKVMATERLEELHVGLT